MKSNGLRGLGNPTAFVAVTAWALMACGNGETSSPSASANGGSTGTGSVQSSSTSTNNAGSSASGSSSSAGETTSTSTSTSQVSSSSGAASSGSASQGGVGGGLGASATTSGTGGVGAGHGGGSSTASTGASASGSGGAASSSSGGGGANTAFTCNLLIGNSTTQQWFDGGFLGYAGIDPTHWELAWVAHHYIDAWANPADAGWTTPLDMGHACASHSTTPDRVIFIVTDAPPYPPESTYQTDLTSIAKNIKAKYPKVQRIEIMTLIRAPGNSDTACSTKANNEQSIPAAEDQGIAAVAGDPTFAGLVVAVPPAYVTSCSDFLTDKPQYTTAGATNIAGVYGAYYAAHP